jgi:hypothetical protein
VFRLVKASATFVSAVDMLAPSNVEVRVVHMRGAAHDPRQSWWMRRVVGTLLRTRPFPRNLRPTDNAQGASNIFTTRQSRDDSLCANGTV